MRARRSWRRSWVPSGWLHDGLLSLALKSISLIGWRQARGPASTATTIARRITVPTMARRWRRKRRLVSRHREERGSAAATASLPATGGEAPLVVITGRRSAGRATRTEDRLRDWIPPPGTRK